MEYTKAIEGLAKKHFKFTRDSELIEDTDFNKLWDAVRGTGDVNYIMLILQRGIKTSTNENGYQKYYDRYTCLHFAVEHGVLDVCSILLNHHANVGMKTEPHGLSALHLAVEHGHIEIIKLLIAHGAPIDSRGGDLSYKDEAYGGFGKRTRDRFLTPLVLAARKDDIVICRILIENGAEYRKVPHMAGPFYDAIRNGCTEATKLFLALGCKFNHNTLWLTISYGRGKKEAEVVDILL